MAVELDPILWSVIVCPADHGTLSAGTAEDPEAELVSCADCGRRYPVRDGIPVLLLDEAIEPATS